MALAGRFGSDADAALGPTATQSEESAHDTELKVPNPSGTLPACHVKPASLVTKIESPTAMHSRAVGQVTEPSPKAAPGSDTGTQVAPPSSDR